MVKKRLIPSLLVRNGRIIQSVNFRHTNVIGNAFTAVDFFNTWAVDEIIILAHHHPIALARVGPDVQVGRLVQSKLKDVLGDMAVRVEEGGQCGRKLVVHQEVHAA